MPRFAGRLSLAFAVLAVGLSLAVPDQPRLALALGSLSLLFSVAELVTDPRRALLLLSYSPAFLITIAVYTFGGPAAGIVAFTAAALGLAGRLEFVRTALEARARNARFAGDLLERLPARVSVFIDVDIESEVERSALQEGHLVRIRPGDVLPADGQVTYGSSFVDESPIGGEREARTKGMGSFVFAGSVNQNGSFLYRALGSSEQSQAARLARLLRTGFPFETLFSPKLFLLEGILGILALAIYFLRPETLAPLLNAFLASMGAGFTAAAWVRNEAIAARAAGEGVAWKNREALDRLARVESVVAPAPGVLTEGRFRLSAIQGTSHTGEDGALRLLGPLARRLENELAFSVLQELQVRNIPLEMVEAYSPMPGGSVGLVTGEEVRWVDLETARIESVPMAELEAFAREHSRAGESIILLLRENRAAAALAFRDRTLPTALGALTVLRREDIPFLLVSPESETTLQRLKEELQLPHVQADAGPREAESLLARLASEEMPPLWLAANSWRLNARDATVAAPASVGPELSSAADVVTLSADLRSIAGLLRLARIYRDRAQMAFYGGLASQVGLVLLGLILDPRFAALLGILPGLMLVRASARIFTARV